MREESVGKMTTGESFQGENLSNLYIYVNSERSMGKMTEERKGSGEKPKNIFLLICACIH